MGEPHTMKEVLTSKDASIARNKTGTLTELPKNRRVIQSKCMFKVKPNGNGSTDRFKERLVAKRLS